MHVAGATPASTAGNVLPLRKLVVALGGSIVPASRCRVCVLTAPEAPAPALGPGGCAVPEDWLLEGVVRWELPQLGC